jgi:hypothetical protein
MKSLVLSLLPLLALSGCTFTYLPLVREARAPEPRLTVLRESALVQNGGNLELTLALGRVPEADWLAVQWFDPSNSEVAAESVWLEPGAAPQTLELALPSRVALSDGWWRAVVSYQGRLIRQFSATVSGRQAAFGAAAAGGSR